MDLQGPPPPHPWQQPQPPSPAYAPPPPGRRWFPIAVIVAIIAAGILIAAAIVIAGGDKSHPAAEPSTPRQSAPVSAGARRTCQGWQTTNSALNEIPALPDGWDWDTPNIDKYIANGNTAIGKALDIFQSEINPSDPPEIVAAAKDYISEKRTEMAKLSDHTYGGADGVSGNVAYAKLNQLCGVKDHG
jgi:hypothetical protein